MRAALLLLLLLTGCRPPAPGGLLFASARSGNWEIWLQAPGAQAVNLTRYPATERFPEWSPDRRRLLYVSDRSGSFDLYLSELDGGNSRVLATSPYPDTTPRWSRQGGIVFVSDRTDRNEELYVVQPDGENLRRLTENPAPDYDPAWLPDGRALVFVSERSGSPELWHLKIDGGEAVQLTHDRLDKRAPDVSPDGRWVAFARRQGQKWELVRLNLADSTLEVLEQRAGWLGNPRWLDNQSLIFAAGKVRNFSLWRLALGGRPQRLALGPDVREATWQADASLPSGAQ